MNKKDIKYFWMNDNEQEVSTKFNKLSIQAQRIIFEKASFVYPLQTELRMDRLFLPLLKKMGEDEFFENYLSHRHEKFHTIRWFIQKADFSWIRQHYIKMATHYDVLELNMQPYLWCFPASEEKVTHIFAYHMVQPFKALSLSEFDAWLMDVKKTASEKTLYNLAIYFLSHGDNKLRNQIYNCFSKQFNLESVYAFYTLKENNFHIHDAISNRLLIKLITHHIEDHSLSIELGQRVNMNLLKTCINHVESLKETQPGSFIRSMIYQWWKPSGNSIDDNNENKALEFVGELLDLRKNYPKQLSVELFDFILSNSAYSLVKAGKMAILKRIMDDFETTQEVKQLTMALAKHEHPKIRDMLSEYQYKILQEDLPNKTNVKRNKI